MGGRNPEQDDSGRSSNGASRPATTGRSAWPTGSKASPERASLRLPRLCRARERPYGNGRRPDPFGMLHEPSDLLSVGVAKSSTSIFVLQRLHCVVGAPAHAHWQGNAFAALSVGEWIVLQPFLQPPIHILVIA